MIRFFFLCIPVFLFSFEFKVATYNLENLFDGQKQGNEYQEYTPGNKHGWNEAMVEKKIANLARVIEDIDADIIALVEVENKEILQRLNFALKNKRYPYLFYPVKKSHISIETALLSRYPIEKTESITIKDQPRGIHKVTVTIEGKPLDVYINHWPAHREKEQERLMYATHLRNALRQEGSREFLLMGDFNSPLQILKDDWGLAFNRVLKSNDKEEGLSNLWYELPEQKRYSHSYGKNRSALDHIVIAKTLHDGKGIEYKKGSFQAFVKPYMLNDEGLPKRWQITDRGRGKHVGDGFSDHLPITATFHIVAH